MKIKALPVEVYRHGTMDCTNGGISGRYNKLLLACPDGSITIDADVGIPESFCMVERRRLFGDEEHLRIVPATVNEDGEVVARPGWWMNGGNIASTSDSRFHALTGISYALDIHDRQE